MQSHPNPVVWFEIYVQDMPRAKAFYEAVLGVQLTRMPAPSAETAGSEMWTFPSASETAMDAYGACGMLVCMPGAPVGSGGTLVYFGCEDCAVQAARVVEAGGTIARDKTSIGEHGHFVLACDPEGNRIGFHSM